MTFVILCPLQNVTAEIMTRELSIAIGRSGELLVSDGIWAAGIIRTVVSENNVRHTYKKLIWQMSGAGYALNRAALGYLAERAALGDLLTPESMVGGGTSEAAIDSSQRENYYELLKIFLKRARVRSMSGQRT